MSKKKIGIGIIALVILGAVTFDQYMKVTWDHHIVGSLLTDRVGYGSMKIKRSKEDRWSKLTPIEHKKYKTLYPKQFELKKLDDKYLWISNDSKPLVKTIEFEKEKLKWLVFTEPQENIVIKVLINEYELIKGCPESTDIDVGRGRMSIYTPFNNGDIVKVSLYIDIYENLLRHLLCDD